MNKLWKRVVNNNGNYIRDPKTGSYKIRHSGIMKPQYCSLFINPMLKNPYKYIEKVEFGDSLLSAQYSTLFDNLLKADKKKKIFKVDNSRLIGYPTPFPVSDWLNGYLVRVPDLKHPGKYLETWPNIGTFSGQFILIIGNSQTGKSTFCIQSGSSIVRPFKNGLMLHVDGEHSSNPERIIKLNHYTPEEYDSKYKFIEIDTIEDLFTMIMDIATEKFTNAAEYEYDTGHLDQFGNPLKMLEPTVVLIDAIPSLQTNEIYDNDGNQTSEMMGQTYDMRIAKALNSFYKRLRPVVHRANIIVYAINHLKDKPTTGGYVKAAKIQYLKPDEAIPGGTGPIYLSQTMYRIIYKKAKKMEDDGFDGYQVSVQCYKSKTNRSNTSFTLMYDYDKGFDPWRSMLDFLDNAGVVEGRNPYRYFKHFPDIKFSSKKFPDEIEANPEILNAMEQESRPLLYALLGTNQPDPNLDIAPEKLNKLLTDAYTVDDLSSFGEKESVFQ